MRSVPIKGVEQQNIQTLHRVRQRLMGARNAPVNEICGLLAEYGIVLPKGINAFRKGLMEKLETEAAKLTPLSQELFRKLFEAFQKLETEVADDEDKLQAMATTHIECQRLLTIPGIGPLTSTALIAAGSAVDVFKNGRWFAAWLGLVPKQHSSEGQTRLLGSATGR